MKTLVSEVSSQIRDDIDDIRARAMVDAFRPLADAALALDKKAFDLFDDELRAAVRRWGVEQVECALQSIKEEIEAEDAEAAAEAERLADDPSNDEFLNDPRRGQAADINRANRSVL